MGQRFHPDALNAGWQGSSDVTSPASHALPAMHAADTGRAPTCEIRALTTAAELADSYRLRYEVYGTLGYLRCSNRFGLEIDAYDLSSIPFGAFHASTGEMVGTLRLITSEPVFEYEWLITLLLTELSDPEIAEQALAARHCKLPSVASDDIEREITAFNSGGYAVHELSRFIVHPAHRSANLSLGLVMAAMAYAMQSGPALFIASCLPRHVPLYAKYGFSKLPNTEFEYFDSVGQIANTIICRSDFLPRPMQSRMDDLLRSAASGASEHTHELSRDSRALFRLAAARPGRRTTLEW
jgi:N-acyl-L-homoserine lactone synthetase